MLNIRISDVVNQIVEHELVNKGRDGKALYMHFDLHMSYYSEDSARGLHVRSSRGLHLLYHCPRERSYISVFSGVTASPFDNAKDVKTWKHETTHDSCWRSISAFSSLYFDMAEEINSSLVANGHKAVAPAMMDECNNFALFGKKMFSWFPVTVKTDDDDVSRYRKIVTLL
ncbi:MAG: hypothetical protein KGH64_05470 [Candidatus Micrarchaeota archaeon]|nr:hypothetical protein [Candidatus Micrarchaeota archaeon]